MREILLNGKWPLILPEHRAARPEWTQEPFWEQERLNAMYEVVQAGDVVYDVGAEEGDISALLAQWASPGGGVVLFEPNPRVWPNIKAIFETNGLLPPMLNFVGFAAETSSDLLDAAIQMGAGAWPKCADGPIIGDHGFCNLSERFDIPRVRIDALCCPGPYRPPDVITIDSEGSELRVLKGAEQTLANHRPEVFVSVHPAFMSEMYGDSQDELFLYMDELGYDKLFLGEDHELHYHFSPF